MDSDHRPHHRTGASTSELFICFTSSSHRLSSSSSMKISSKSILSPNRTGRDHPQISLSKSVSRRLRTNGSIRGLSSPMFPTGGANNKKRGCGFENPEPSSPKVTCIGQVRVKTKKKGKKIRTLSRRRCGAGEVSFRKVELSREGSHHYQQSEHRNQRWVHLPLTICEALKAFGAEFSCLFPCRPSSCFSTGERGKDEDKEQSYCGNVFARWLVAMNDGDGVGKGREIELVVGGEEEGRRSFSRDRMFVREIEDVGDDDDKWKVKDEDGEEGGRVSICVPPKNALLLMRCRSDPLKLSALANRMCESPVPVAEEEEDEEIDNAVKGDISIDIDDVDVGQQTDGDDEEGKQIEDGGVEEEGKLIKDNDEEVEVEDQVKVEEMVQSNDRSSLEDEGWEECSNGNRDSDEEENRETEMMGIVMEAEEVDKQEENDNPDEELVFCNEEELEIDNLDEESVFCEEEESEKENPEEELVFCKEEESEIDNPEEELEVRKEEESENYNPEEELELCKKEEAENDNVEEELELCKEEESENDNPEEELEFCKEEESETEEIQEPEVEETNKASQEEEESEFDGFCLRTLFGEEKLDGEEEAESEQIGGLAFESEETEKSTVEESIDPQLTVPSSLSKEEEIQEKMTEEEEKEKRSESELPDCLLLMMCEPKLSMEVSKETWVCSTDFIRPLPMRQVNTTDGPDEPEKMKKKIAHQPPAAAAAPPRSSCSFPAPAISMNAMTEQRLGYEPFVLTRCKSAPVRTTPAAKVVPEAAASSCCWNNGKLEPHRRATFGFGAAGVGF